MAIDLLNIQPHKVSKDLSGYITFIYGPPKVGKTTIASQFPDALLLAWEKGYNALPGVYAQDINTWAEMKQVYRALKTPQVQEKYKTLVVDTADIASDACQKYICNQLGIDNIGDGGWTNNGWAKYKKEFDDVFRSLAMMGYAVVFISHAKEKKIEPKGKAAYDQICPTLQTSACSIIENMADIYGYAHIIEGTPMLTLRCPDETIKCGGRFKYIAQEIPLGYEELAKALHEAIDKEAAMHNNKFVTEEREATNLIVEYDYDALMSEFSSLINPLMEKDMNYYGPRVTQIIEKYLGKGKKVGDTTREQAEFIFLINQEIKDTLF